MKLDFWVTLFRSYKAVAMLFVMPILSIFAACGGVESLVPLYFLE